MTSLVLEGPSNDFDEPTNKYVHAARVISFKKGGQDGVVLLEVTQTADPMTTAVERARGFVATKDPMDVAALLESEHVDMFSRVLIEDHKDITGQTAHIYPYYLHASRPYPKSFSSRSTLQINLERLVRYLELDAEIFNWTGDQGAGCQEVLELRYQRDMLTTLFCENPCDRRQYAELREAFRADAVNSSKSFQSYYQMYCRSLKQLAGAPGYAGDLAGMVAAIQSWDMQSSIERSKFGAQLTRNFQLHPLMATQVEALVTGVLASPQSVNVRERVPF